MTLSEVHPWKEETVESVSFSDVRVILVHFLFQVPPEIKITLTEIRISGRSQSFDDYSSFKHYTHNGVDMLVVLIFAGNTHTVFISCHLV